MIPESSGFFDPLSGMPTVEVLNAASDIFISGSYLILLMGLILFARARRDPAYRTLVFIIGLFLFCAGTASLVHPWTYELGNATVEAALKFLTAIFSLVVVALLWRLRRRVLMMPDPMNLLPPIVQAISETKDIHSAFQIALKKICETAGWNYGEVWIPTADGKVLECASASYGGETFSSFREISRELRFAPNIDLAGRVWSTQQPQWLRNVFSEKKPIFFRARMAKEAGFKTALGVPLLLEGRVLAVMIFLSSESRPEDPRMIDLVSTVATHVGSVINRNQAQEALRESGEELERVFQQKNEELLKEKEELEKDVASLRTSAESLKKSKDLSQDIINSIEGIVWELDLASQKLTFVSQQAERMLGYPSAAWLADPGFWQEHIHGSDRDFAVGFRSRVVREKTDYQFEYRMITADGHTRWFRDMVKVVIEKGEAVRLRGTMVDITEQKLVEEALSQERNYTRAVLDTASALVIILDTEGKILRFNQTCEQLSGFSQEDFKDRYFWEMLPVEEAQKVKTLFSRLRAGQFPVNYESAWFSKDGTKQTIAWSLTVLFNKENAPVNLIATGIDISKRKEVEQKLAETIAKLERSNQELDISTRKLQEANMQLKKLDELKSQFISAASHELKTPLTSMEGYLDVVLQGEAGPVNDTQRKFLGNVKQAADRLHRMLIELLNLSKIESGQVEMNHELTDLAELLKGEVATFKAQADGKEIPLDLTIDVDLKKIVCDGDKIREVMDNLLSNAIKYTPRGGKVKISSANHEKGIRIDVQDTGIGIKAEDLERIFEPFQSIEKGEVENEESTGLGLTLVKKIVEAHQGEVKVQSQEGKGSTFTVMLPLKAFPTKRPVPQVIPL